MEVSVPTRLPAWLLTAALLLLLPQIEVDVYRRVGPVRAEPWQGASSFFQEHLIKWRELNSASHFLRVRGQWAQHRPVTVLPGCLPAASAAAATWVAAALAAPLPLLLAEWQPHWLHCCGRRSSCCRCAHCAFSPPFCPSPSLVLAALPSGRACRAAHEHDAASAHPPQG